jgi:hypothetical protein
LLGYFSANGTGQGVAAATVVSAKGDASQTVELIFACSDGLRCSAVPVDLSDGAEHALVLYGTGIRAATSVTVLLGELAADVTYFGPQPESPGLDQVNVRIPKQLAGRGEIDIVLRADGQEANRLNMRIRWNLHHESLYENIELGFGGMRAAEAVLSCILAVGVFQPCGVKAEEAGEPLQNADVVGMMKAGLPERTVIFVIQLATERGPVNFDTSTAALIELRQQGASGDILNAILWAQQVAGAPLRKKSAEVSSAPGLPNQSGLYHRSPAGWVALPSSLVWPPLMAPRKVLAGFRHNYDFGIPLSALHATRQIADRQPTFHVRDFRSGERWQILQLAIKKDQRELRMVYRDTFPSEITFQPGTMRQVELERVADDVFTVRPNAALDPGEYLLCTTVGGRPSLFQCYEFGIAETSKWKVRFCAMLP